MKKLKRANENSVNCFVLRKNDILLANRKPLNSLTLIHNTIHNCMEGNAVCFSILTSMHLMDS